VMRSNASEASQLLGRLSQLPPSDVRSLLLVAFAVARHETGLEVEYLNDAGQVALSLTYNKRGGINEIRPEAGLTADAIAALQGAYSSFVAAQDNAQFDAMWLFADRPVRGWWRYRDVFQILPPPQNAPVPHEWFGHWPFLVEVRFRAPLEPWQAKFARRRRATRELRRLLPVLVTGPLFFPHHPSRPAKHWVVPHGADQSPIFAQELYVVPGQELGGPELTETSGLPPLQEVGDVRAYLNHRGRTGDEELEVPANLTDLLDKYYALPMPTRKHSCGPAIG
jgi:hypothetical protein